MLVRLAHLGLGLRMVPGLLLDRRQRRLLASMRAFVTGLPGRLAGPLPEVLRALDHEPAPPVTGLTEDTIRRVSDLAALLARRNPLGLCLRQSLARYHALRRVGVPLRVHFGARHVAPRQGEVDLNGHAWVTLAGLPYHERDTTWQTFTVMLSWPGEPPG